MKYQNELINLSKSFKTYEIADLLGASASSVYEWRNGIRKPKKENRDRIARLHKELLGGAVQVPNNIPNSKVRKKPKYKDGRSPLRRLFNIGFVELELVNE